MILRQIVQRLALGIGLTAACAVGAAAQTAIDVIPADGKTDQIIRLADRRDGKPLGAGAGPLQIVVPHEKRAGRWIRQVSRLEIRQAK